jgi:hypothetical protein
MTAIAGKFESAFANCWKKNATCSTRSIDDEEFASLLRLVTQVVTCHNG